MKIIICDSNDNIMDTMKSGGFNGWKKPFWKYVKIINKDSKK